MMDFWKKRIILRLQAMFVREIISTSKRYSYMELKRMKLKKFPMVELVWAGKVDWKDTF
jgi:hypothetical protein